MICREEKQPNVSLMTSRGKKKTPKNTQDEDGSISAEFSKQSNPKENWAAQSLQPEVAFECEFHLKTQLCLTEVFKHVRCSLL